MMATSIDKPTRVKIRQLDDVLINRIAAGEVIERPSSAIKELVENAIDANATQIEVFFADGGKTLIRVKDNGDGIAKDELALALSRHATSKLTGSDLLQINSLGFRGEALPSLGAVGKLTITSREIGSEGAYQITCNGGDISDVSPAALAQGTVVELKDIFYATPARLKFMKTDRAETQSIIDVVKRLAMSAPSIAMRLVDVTGGGAGRVLFDYPCETGSFDISLGQRLAKILGKAFVENSFTLNAERDGYHLTGLSALPTYSRGNAMQQYFFVNGRVVRDKQLIGALRAAYMDVLSRNRHSVAALFLNCDTNLVDVNVHPGKAEVRFRDAGLVRGMLISAIRHGLAEVGYRSSTTVADGVLDAMQPQPTSQSYYQGAYGRASSPNIAYSAQTTTAEQFGFSETTNPSGYVVESRKLDDETSNPLGAARAQLHENYIIAQTKTGMVIVDQHAAHERLVYEKLKKNYAAKQIETQTLLIPDVIELEEPHLSNLLAIKDELSACGVTVEAFGGNSIIVRETPAILGNVNAKRMIQDVIEELEEQGNSSTVLERVNAILSRVSCHGSIRSGRRMRAEEMSALLREMEATPYSGQCNHGRPTYVELKLSDIEKLFGRT